MGDRMRAFDWSATPLGPVERWPESLRTVVGVCLRSRFTFWIGWGPDLLFFYNDAYRPVLKAKHPWALGRPALEVWAEVEDLIGPMLRSVLATGEATWATDQRMMLERNGYVEETYFTFSYSPISDEFGRVVGVLTSLVETTEQVVAARRLRTLRELGARTLDANTAEETIARAIEVIEANAADLPFCHVFLPDGAAHDVRLAGSTGPSANPPCRWPFERIAASGRAELVRELPKEVGAEEATAAFVVPLASANGGARTGFVALGVSSQRPFDEGYRGFLELVAAGIGSALARAHAYEAERRRAEALAEIDRAKTEFFSNVSHELRTPLTLVLGPLEDALRDDVRTFSTETLGAMHRSSRRLLRMVNALLDFSRIEAGRARASLEPVDLAAFTADVVSVFRAAFEEANLSLDVDCPPLPEPVWVDREQWEKIVLNLVSNAFKFTFTGGVHVTLRAEAGRAELRVDDTGTGIPAAELPHVFERFRRVEGARSRTYEGTGIGLSLVRELVKLHEGTIDVRSEVGRGSTFVVTLPLGRRGPSQGSEVRLGRDGTRSSMDAQTLAEEAKRLLPSTVPVRKTEAQRRGARVLVADDNADMRDYVTRILEEAGFDVAPYPDGAAALEAALASPPDLVLTDVMMPGIDGFGLLRALRADARTRAVPVVMLSARAGEEARVEGFAEGAEDYLVKPFSARELVARVVSLVELARLRRAAEAERDRMRSLLLQVPVVVNFLRGPDLVFDFVHPLTPPTLGGRAVQGMPLLEAVPELADQPTAHMIRAVYEEGRTISGHEQLVQFADDAGLRDTYWNFTFLPIRNARGEIEGVMTCAVDVTEQVSSREAIRKSEAALRDAAKRKDEFLAMLGHELRNPLAPMRMAVSILQARLPGTDKSRRYLDILDRQIATLTRLVEDLLDVSRVTRGVVELRAERLDLRPVVQHAFEAVRTLFDQRQHGMTIASSVDALYVVGDAIRLEQIVVNLLTNAAKYTDPGGRIALSVRPEGPYAVICVRDTGIGIAHGMLTRIFELFEQAGRGIERSQGGLGVGLTVVKSLVELHGGTVNAMSAGLGRGAEFTVRLPLAPAEPVRAPNPELSAPATWGDSPASYRVLVVDDNHHAAETLSALLAQSGHAVDVAHDGPTALRLCDDRQLDLVILDLGMPGMDGFEVARKIRGSRSAGGALLVALTGYGSNEYRDRALASGFDRHLVKPVSMDALRDLLRGVGVRK